MSTEPSAWFTAWRNSGFPAVCRMISSMSRSLPTNFTASALVSPSRRNTAFS
ncbi:MAG: hypothetical protein R2789_14560 [Microthrixaceae bacterium]